MERTIIETTMHCPENYDNAEMKELLTVIQKRTVVVIQEEVQRFGMNVYIKAVIDINDSPFEET